MAMALCVVIWKFHFWQSIFLNKLKIQNIFKVTRATFELFGREIKYLEAYQSLCIVFVYF
jgi:uncharacterized protein involved in tolerance to divalent cations